VIGPSGRIEVGGTTAPAAFAGLRQGRYLQDGAGRRFVDRSPFVVPRDLESQLTPLFSSSIAHLYRKGGNAPSDAKMAGAPRWTGLQFKLLGVRRAST
jgi:hypothetical protein